MQWTNHAVWQVLDYRDRYRVDFPDHQVNVIGVAEAYTDQAREHAAQRGIRLIIYSFPPDQPLAPGAEAPAV